MTFARLFEIFSRAGTPVRLLHFVRRYSGETGIPICQQVI
jgi:hypothetical protein